MAWTFMSLRKQCLKSDGNGLTYALLQRNRDKRIVHKKLAADQSVFNNEKKTKLREIRQEFLDVKNERPDQVLKSDYEDDNGEFDQDGYDDATSKYNSWQQDYSDAKEEYENQKLDIEEYYDDISEDLEAEAQDEEDILDDEITRYETQRDAVNAELQAITDQVKSDIESRTIKF